MAAGVVQVRGLGKFTRALRKAGVEIQDLKAANTRVGVVVVHAAQPITPHRTGALAGTIRPAERRSGVIVRAGGGRVKYARYVEFGTTKMSARPYLYTGAVRSEPQWMAVYWQAVQDLMNRVEAQANGTGE